MKKITNIEIKNFKSIRHAEIKDCRRINVFIGYPNVGKSNILEALSLFSIDENNVDVSKFVRLENLTTLFHNGEIANQAEIKINEKNRFVVRLNNEILNFQEQFEREGTSFEKKDADQWALDESADVWVKKNFNVGKGNSNIFDFRKSNIGSGNDLCPIKRYEFLKKVSYTNNNYSDLIYPYGNNIFNIISSNSAFRNEVEEMFKPYNLELLYDSREQKFTILKRTKSGIFSIPYELIADTLQRLIFYKASIQSNKGAILLFEEPEAHMFPPYIRKLTTDIVFDKNNNQYFIATHSPYVLDELIAEAESDLSVYLVDYKDGETKIKYLSSIELGEIREYGVDLFFNIESYLKNGQVNNA